MDTARTEDRERAVRHRMAVLEAAHDGALTWPFPDEDRGAVAAAFLLQTVVMNGAQARLTGRGFRVLTRHTVAQAVARSRSRGYG